MRIAQGDLRDKKGQTDLGQDFGTGCRDVGVIGKIYDQSRRRHRFVTFAGRTTTL